MSNPTNLPKGATDPMWDEYEFSHSGFHPADSKKEEPKCWHTWVRYVGFREVYDYCMHCSDKREVPK